MTSNTNDTKCSNAGEKVGQKPLRQNIAHVDNPCFSLRKKPRNDTPLPKNENISLATQTKHKTFQRIYNVSTVRLKKGSLQRIYNVNTVRIKKSNHVNKVRRQNTPIVDKINPEVIPVKARKRDTPGNTQKTEQEKSANEKMRLHLAKSGIVLRTNPHNLPFHSIQEPRKVLEKPLNEPKRNEIKETKVPPDHKQNVDLRLSNKIRQLMTRDVPLNLDDEKNVSKINLPDTEIKKHIISVIRKCNKKQLKGCNSRVTQTSSSNSSLSSTLSTVPKPKRKKNNVVKRKVRRQLWQWAKIAIKNNEHWSKLFTDNKITIDNVNIDGIDLSLIDVDALGIDNKFLKRTIIWLLK